MALLLLLRDARPEAPGGKVLAHLLPWLEQRWPRNLVLVACQHPPGELERHEQRDWLVLPQDGRAGPGLPARLLSRLAAMHEVAVTAVIGRDAMALLAPGDAAFGRVLLLDAPGDPEPDLALSPGGQSPLAELDAALAALLPLVLVVERGEDIERAHGWLAERPAAPRTLLFWKLPVGPELPRLARACAAAGRGTVRVQVGFRSGLAPNARALARLPLALAMLGRIPAGVALALLMDDPHPLLQAPARLVRGTVALLRRAPLEPAP